MFRVASIVLVAAGLVASAGVAKADEGHRGSNIEVRDHRDGRVYRDNRVTVQVRPVRPPPAVRVEHVAPRRGFVWIGGRYDWRNGNYAWSGGHWEHERPNSRWIPGRWEIGTGGYYTWVDGSWQNITPAAVVVRPAPRRGLVWIEGRTEWRHGRAIVIPGHWERVRRVRHY